MAAQLGLLRHDRPLVALLVLSCVVSTVLYLSTSSGSPRAAWVEDPCLNRIDLAGDKPRAIWKDDDFECLGWRATHSCDPHGPRDYSRDRACDQPLPHVSGFCEVRNRTSGEVFRVMLSTCSSWWWKKVPTLSCNDARRFTDFSIHATQYHHPVPPPLVPAQSDPNNPIDYSRGIAMIAYPKVIAGAYAIVRMLRHHGCVLPVEIWVDRSEMRETHSILVELSRSFNVFVRTIEDPNATKFHAKPYVVYHTRFESVLFLDSDNIPLRDPTHLFDSREFVKFGTLFWPDFWKPALDNPFNVHEQSALWQLLDMPFIDMFEQESGQLLVNRTRSKDALNKLMFYAANVPRLLTDWDLVYGDKDLFRLAWLNTTTPFYFGRHLLALGGLYDEKEDFFCGLAMIQQDQRGDFVFLHRNQAKLSGRRDQKVLITHYQKFTGGGGDASSTKRHLDKYRVQCKRHRLGQKMCFLLNPKTPTGEPTPLIIQSLAGSKYPQLEQRAILFSIEGRSLLSKTEEGEIAAMETTERPSAGVVLSILRAVAAVLAFLVTLMLLWRYILLPWVRGRRQLKDRRFSM
ncbi:hypothetical protein Gpo141_00002643 [Globisporangium polare]